MSNSAQFYETSLTFTPTFQDFISLYRGIVRVWIGDGETGDVGVLYAEFVDGVIQRIGPVSDYYYAVQSGYQGTPSEWVAYLLSLPGYADTASAAATAASASAGNAATSASNASTSEANAATSASNAASSATAADGSAEDAEAYAIGKRDGTDVGSSDPAYHNNSKYFANQASGSATSADGSAKDSEAYAVGKRGGTDVSSSDPAYHNNSKYYSDQAGSSAGSASGSANAADASAKDSEAYAVGKRGGTDVDNSDVAYHNNSKYYSEQAGSSAGSASTSALSADGSAKDSEAWAVGKRGGVDVDSSDATYHNNSKYWSDIASAKSDAVKSPTVSITYQNSDYGDTAPSGGTWTNTPSPVKGKYTWERTILTWGDNTTTTYYEASYSGVDGLGSVDSVNTYTGDVVLTGQDIAVSRSDNTLISTAISDIQSDISDIESDVSDIEDNLEDLGPDINVINYTNNARYVTDSDSAINWMKLKLEPQQEGTGTPSSSNIRPFIKYEKLKINRSADTYQNKVQLVESFTKYGITFTVDSANGTVTLNGTANQSASGSIKLGDILNTYGNSYCAINNIPSADGITGVYFSGGIRMKNNDVVIKNTLYSSIQYQLEISFSSGVTTFDNVVITPIVYDLNEYSSYSVDFSGISYFYGGEILIDGFGAATALYKYSRIISYNGETLEGEWFSDRDVYDGTNSPTIGAEVVYEVSNPLISKIEKVTNNITLFSGTNNLWSASGEISLAWSPIDKDSVEGTLISKAERAKLNSPIPVGTGLLFDNGTVRLSLATYNKLFGTVRTSVTGYSGKNIYPVQIDPNGNLGVGVPIPDCPYNYGFGYGTCSTASSTSLKEVSTDNRYYSNESIMSLWGSFFAVKFNNDVLAGASIRINNLSWMSYPIYYNDSSIQSGIINAGDTALFVCHNSKFHYLAKNRIANESLGHGYATCSTAASTVAKEAALTNYNLIVNGIVAVQFTYDVPASATLNVNNKGAKPIYYKGTTIAAGIIKATDIATFMYDGTYYQLISIDSVTNESFGHGYGTCSTAAATAAKEATLSNYQLIVNGISAIRFTYAVPASSTLNINNKGAKAIYYKGAAITADVIKAGDTATFVYDGTYYQLIAIDSPGVEAISNNDIDSLF